MVSSSSDAGNRRPCRPQPRPWWCLCRCMSPPLLVVSFQELGDVGLCAAERLGPAGEEPPPGVGQPVRAARRAREVGVPLGLEDPVLLERAQEAVEVADVHALLADELRQLLDQLVAVTWPLRQEEQDGRLDEALDARADGPAARPVEPPGPRPALAAMAVMRSLAHPAASICQRHM